MHLTNNKLILKKRPDPDVKEDLFDFISQELRTLQKNEFLINVKYLSIDPAMRGWINIVGNYSNPVEINETMRRLGVGKIISSKNKLFCVGEYVVGWLGWQKYSIVNEKDIQIKINPKDVPISANLGVLGVNGITAYAGLLD